MSASYPEQTFRSRLYLRLPGTSASGAEQNGWSWPKADGPLFAPECEKRLLKTVRQGKRRAGFYELAAIGIVK